MTRFEGLDAGRADVEADAVWNQTFLGDARALDLSPRTLMMVLASLPIRSGVVSALVQTMQRMRGRSKCLSAFVRVSRREDSTQYDCRTVHYNRFRIAITIRQGIRLHPSSGMSERVASISDTSSSTSVFQCTHTPSSFKLYHHVERQGPTTGHGL